MSFLRFLGLKTLPELIRAGALNYALGLYEQGHYGKKVRDMLLRRFPDALSRSLDGIISRVKSARDTARWQERYPSERPRRSDVPIDPTIPDAYRYNIHITYKKSDGTTGHFSQPVDSPRNISFEEACAQALYLFDVLFFGPQSKYKYFRRDEDPTEVEAECDLMAVYRRT